MFFLIASPSRRIAQLEELIRELHRPPHTDTEVSGAPDSASREGEQESLSSATQLASGLDIVLPSRSLGVIEISPDDYFDLIDR